MNCSAPSARDLKRKKTMSHKKTQIIIIGAGPVGTTAAYKFASEGIDVVLLEAHPNCPEDLRASTFHPPTLEMLSSLGITDELDAIGLRAPVYQYRNRQTGEYYSFDLGELSDVTRFPYRLQCEQFKLARLLTDRLAEHPHGTVCFNHRLLTVKQDEDGVVVQAETPMGIETFEADFLIACDGANSTVRKWLGVGFEGFTYPEKFVTFSTAVPLEQHFEQLAHVNYVADPTEWMVLLKVPKLWRVLVPAHDMDDDYITSDEMKAKVFDRLIADPNVETVHRTIYRVHQRVAENYVDGRIILAGDAAHLNNPLGGLGMNSGIHDVWNLSEKLLPVLKAGGRHDEPLGLYERQRQAVMRNFVQTQTIKNKKMLENRDPEAQQRYQQGLTEILEDDERRRNYLLDQAMFKSLELEAATS